MISQSSIYGSVLRKNAPPIVEKAKLSIEGTHNGRPSQFKMDAGMLSKHMMLIGGTGCGKTNVFFNIVDQIKSSMTEDDVMIVFDTKGDYYKEFFRAETDGVLSAGGDFQGRRTWNIFKEILSDGEDPDCVDENVSEMTWGLFLETIEKNTSNPFFPSAARDLFASILTCIIRLADGDREIIANRLHNAFLRSKMNTISAADIHALLSKYPDQTSVLHYIGDGQNLQGLGVMAEMQAVVRKFFVGEFAKKGDFSIKEFVRNKGGRTLFIEYDLARGASLTPVYRLLIDQAFKEAMSRKGKGNVYVFCDEFKLLPCLQHLEDAVNFGRSLGVKVFAGLQSINQLNETYGEARAANIIAGFSTVVSFKANDEATRSFTSGLYGKNYVLDQYKTLDKPYMQSERLGDVVEDWEISSLQVGEAVVGLPNTPPYVFRFGLYPKKGE
ncbi:MAG: type IV secretion system DNA-binding domain-containing protein [Clostridia bacterium]|nr:type IV secretion system DNA-binding domain-containing protein [Clostridia bacterium]